MNKPKINELIQVQSINTYNVKGYNIYVLNNDIDLIVATDSHISVGMYIRFSTKKFGRYNIPYEIYKSVDGVKFLRIYPYKDIFYYLLLVVRQAFKLKKP